MTHMCGRDGSGVSKRAPARASEMSKRASVCASEGSARVLASATGSVIALAVLAVMGGGIATARAQTLEDCGEIYVGAQATCVVDPPGIDCDVACQPLRVQAACAGRAYLDCEGECDLDLEASCTASCQGSCEASCSVDPGAFDCQASCQASCSGSCQASCASDDARCAASCKATCAGECDASCNVRPPKAECQAQCQASCSGSCRAKANLDCQVSCQSDFYVKCEAELSGGCKAECTTQSGALFCEGNYVDTGDHLERCVDALKESLNVQVTYSAEGECAGGMCSGHAEASCSALPNSDSSAAGGAPWLIAVLAYAVRRRTRSQRLG